MGWGQPSTPGGGPVPDTSPQTTGEPQPTNQDGSLIPTPDTAKAVDPDTTLGGDPFVQTEPEVAEPAELTLVPTDVFEVIVRYAQERAYDTPPTFDSYDEAREVGIDLLTNHADARSFSITKTTILR